MAELRKHMDNNNEDAERSVGELLSDLWRMVKAERWVAGGVATLVTVAAAAYIGRLPNIYRSEATIESLRQAVSARVVSPDSVTPNEGIDTMMRQMLSRNSLLRIANDLNLYGAASGRLTPDEILGYLEQDLSTEAITQGPSNTPVGLRISFLANDPQLAQQMVSRLTALFIEENLKARGRHVESTTNFLNDRVKEASVKLAEQEARMQSYLSRYNGQLPEQQQSNAQELALLRGQSQAIAANRTLAEQRRTNVEFTLNDRLLQLESEKAALLKQYTEQYSTVIKKTQLITATASLLEDVRAGRQPRAASEIDDAVLRNARDQWEMSRADLQRYDRQEAELRDQINAIDSRLKAAPMRQQELEAIQRDYNLYKQDYNELKKSQMNADMGVTVEQRQEGDQFRIVDSASLPTKPAGPNRRRLSLAALVLGLALGLLVGFLKDASRPAFHTEEEVRRAFVTPVVVGVPTMWLPAEKRRQSFWRIFEFLAAAAMIGIVAASQWYVFTKG